MYTNISIKLILNNTNIFKNSYLINNLSKVLINTSLSAEFILLEREERIKLCSKPIDNPIERYGYHITTKNLTQLLNDSTMQNDNTILIDYDFKLNNLVKEIIWTFELTINNYILILNTSHTKFNDLYDFTTSTLSNVYKLNTNPLNGDPSTNPITNQLISKKLNGQKSNGQKSNEKKSNEKITTINSLNTSSNFTLNTKFFINGIRRDGVENLNHVNQDYSDIVKTINLYKYNTKAELKKSYNAYSFALEPEEFQPTGAINMSKINTFTIQIEIDKIKILEYLNTLSILFDLNDVKITMKLNTIEYNLVRYQSGLAGLLFVN